MWAGQPEDRAAGKLCQAACRGAGAQRCVSVGEAPRANTVVRLDLLGNRAGPGDGRRLAQQRYGLHGSMGVNEVNDSAAAAAGLGPLGESM